jgi:hypothetical protein
MVATVRVLPPVLFLCCIQAMASLSELMPLAKIVWFPFSLAGLPLVLLGMAITVVGSR